MIQTVKTTKTNLISNAKFLISKIIHTSFMLIMPINKVKIQTLLQHTDRSSLINQNKLSNHLINKNSQKKKTKNKLNSINKTRITNPIKKEH